MNNLYMMAAKMRLADGCGIPVCLLSINESGRVAWPEQAGTYGSCTLGWPTGVGHLPAC